MQNIAPDRVSFYPVPLVCPVAPEIGCGSRSKPVLLALERRPVVAQAWLNRPGTLIAIVWGKESSQASRDEATRSLNPESLKAAEYAKRICEQAWGCRTDEPTVEEVMQSFAGLLRYCPTLGPETQEVLRCNLDRLIERLGLTCEVNRALETPVQETGAKARGS